MISSLCIAVQKLQKTVNDLCVLDSSLYHHYFEPSEGDVCCAFISGKGTLLIRSKIRP